MALHTPVIATWQSLGNACVGGGPCGLFGYSLPPTVNRAAIVVPAVAAPPIVPVPLMLEVDEMTFPVTVAGIVDGGRV